jgi:hypothetical protein
MKGHIRQRGKQSREPKFDAGRDSATGTRKIRYFSSFKGTKREAQTKLATLNRLYRHRFLCRAEQDDGGRLRARPCRPMGSRWSAVRSAEISQDDGHQRSRP